MYPFPLLPEHPPLPKHIEGRHILMLGVGAVMAIPCWFLPSQTLDLPYGANDILRPAARRSRQEIEIGTIWRHRCCLAPSQTRDTNL